ncbi:PREDICTED: uncharacterized protein LOC109332543 [Lupinus angustifolius]|uniref:uncharacterized protein LOC109332543 n=1 Tax=Lupinus angustifolius TaxID=3871 RepID=UPI00092E6FEA|nr:PREDICTED: uncharacterized protein LOC109332543 [Lupinus angustifolius]
MNGDGALGPDGFGRCFYQHIWDIVEYDVCNSISQFFTNSWIMPNLNSNTVILIPKSAFTERIEDFRPIALANFQFKIITKVLAYRESLISNIIVSPKQKRFLKGRSTQDCICTSSEAINLLDHKIFGGNMAIKLNIRKAFDTLDWIFLLDTLQAFGFNVKFINWIKIILHSAKLTINVNGQNAGIKRELLALKNLVDNYASTYGQRINPSKCKFCTIGSARKIANLSYYLGFNAGDLPFTYLGVLLFKGKPRKLYLQPIVDRITNKLAKWKGHSLSIMGRVELVKKMVTVSWAQVCTTLKCGGLGLRSLNKIKVAALLKLAWEMLSSDQDLAIFCINRFGNDTTPSSRYFKSSIWPGIRANWHTAQINSIWLIGDGHTINFWKDNWHDEPLVESLNIPEEFYHNLLATVGDFILDFKRIIPQVLADRFSDITLQISRTTLAQNKDKCCWQNSNDGMLTLKVTFNCISPTANNLSWCNYLWSASIPPSKSFITWRLINKKILTDENLKKRGCYLASVCHLCMKNTENVDHLFLSCAFAVDLWNRLNSIFSINLDTPSISTILLSCTSKWSPQGKIFWLLVLSILLALYGIVEIN